MWGITSFVEKISNLLLIYTWTSSGFKKKKTPFLTHITIAILIKGACLKNFIYLYDSQLGLLSWLFPFPGSLHNSVEFWISNWKRCVFSHNWGRIWIKASPTWSISWFLPQLGPIFIFCATHLKLRCLINLHACAHTCSRYYHFSNICVKCPLYDLIIK